MSQNSKRIEKVFITTVEDLIEIMKKYNQITVVRKDSGWSVSYVIAV